MRKLLNQRGIASWEVVVGLLVVAIIGVAGYRVYNNSKATTPTSSAASTAQVGSSPSSTTVPKAPTVNSASSLDQASNTLDQVDPSSSNASDSNQLTTQNNY